MPIVADTRAQGISQAIAELAKLDPTLRKEIRRETKRIVRPIIDDAKTRYPKTAKGQSPLRGVNYNWAAISGSGFPYNQAAARRGLRFFCDISRPNRTVIRVRQINAAAAVLEYVGSRSNNGLGEAVTARYGSRNRFLWKAAEAELPAVTREMRQVIERMVFGINRRNQTESARM